MWKYLVPQNIFPVLQFKRWWITDVAVDVDTEWHTGDAVPRMLSDFDSGCSGRAMNGHMPGLIGVPPTGSSCRLNTLRSYGVTDGAVVGLCARQTTTMSQTMSSSASTVYANSSLSSSRRMPMQHPYAGSRTPSTGFLIWCDVMR